MLIGTKQIVDERPQLDRIRRTTLYRFLTLNGVKCHDGDSHTTLKSKMVDNGLFSPEMVIDEKKINEAWAKKRANEQDKKMTRQEMIKKASELKIPNAMKMKNPELEEAIINAEKLATGS